MEDDLRTFLEDRNITEDTIQRMEQQKVMIFSCDQEALYMAQSVCLSVPLSVRLSHLFHYVPIIVSSRNFQELLPVTGVRSIQKVKVSSRFIGQGHRGQNPT